MNCWECWAAPAEQTSSACKPCASRAWPLQEEGLLLQLLLIFVKYWVEKKIISIVQKGHVQDRAGF